MVEGMSWRGGRNYNTIQRQAGLPSTTAEAHPTTFLWAWSTGQMKSFKVIKGRRNEELPEFVLIGALRRARMKRKTQRERAKQMRNYIPEETVQAENCEMSLAGSPFPLRKCEVCALQTEGTHYKHGSITLSNERGFVFTFQRRWVTLPYTERRKCL